MGLLMKMAKYSVKMGLGYFALGTYENGKVQCKNGLRLFRGGY